MHALAKRTLIALGTFPHQHVPVLKESLDVERMDIDLIEALFHGGYIDLISRILQIACASSQSPRHPVIANRPHVALPVDDIRANKQLFRLSVYHSVGRRTTYALRARNLSHRR